MLETFGVHPNCVRPWAELLLFDLLPTVMLALGDAWLTAFLWFNQMQYVVLAVELLYPGCYAPDFGDARRDNVVPAPPNAMNGPPPPPPRKQQCGAVDENVPLCDHCLSINVPKVAMRCPSKHRTCLACLYEHVMVQRSRAADGQTDGHSESRDVAPTTRVDAPGRAWRARAARFGARGHSTSRNRV